MGLQKKHEGPIKELGGAWEEPGRSLGGLLTQLRGPQRELGWFWRDLWKTQMELDGFWEEGIVKETIEQFLKS